MKASKSLTRVATILLVVFINIGCDQVSKSVVRRNIGYYERVDVVEDHLTITKVENTGAFLSAGHSLPGALKSLLLIFIPVLALVAGLYYLITAKRMQRVMLFALCCMIGGGIGNIYDRIVYGSVTDFLFIQAGPFKTGIFNLADVSVTAGIWFLILYTLWKKRVVHASQK